MIWKRERERANSWKESMEEMIIFSGEKKRKFCTNITIFGRVKQYLSWKFYKSTKLYWKIQTIVYSQKIKFSYPKDLLCYIHYLVATRMCIKHSHKARNFKLTNTQQWVIYSDSYVNGIFFPTFYFKGKNIWRNGTLVKHREFLVE